MARFEKERDPEEIQERLSLSATIARDTDGSYSNELLCRDDHIGRDTRKRTQQQYDNSNEYRPKRSTSSCVTSSLQKSVLSEEKTMKNAPGHKVFIANLSFSTTERMIENHMARVGSILRVLLFKNPNGTSKGMGIVQYRNEDSVDRAISELCDSELDKRRVYIRKHMEEEERERCGFITINRPIDRPRPPANPSATVFINNLDYNCTWQQIKDVFKAAGKIVYCEVQLDKEGQSKGMASVQYERPIEALNAIALFHGQVLYNRALMVRMDNRSPIKPDSMTVKQVFGGSLNMYNQSTAALALLGKGLGMSLFSMGMGNNELQQHNFTSMSNGGYFPNSDNSTSSLTTPHAPPLLPSPFILQQSISSDDLNNKPTNQQQSKCNVTMTSNSANDYTYNSPGQYDHEFLYTKAPSSKERRVMIRNINFKTSWQKLKDLFRNAGTVLFVDIMQGSDGRPNGSAFVLFDKAHEAHKAIELFHNSELDGRKIEVQLDKQSRQ